MELEAWREQIQAAIADPRRRQLAHIAILEVAMSVGHALEASGLPQDSVDEATEAVSGYLKGELSALPDSGGGGTIVDLVTTVLTKLSEEPAFVQLFV